MVVALRTDRVEVVTCAPAPGWVEVGDRVLPVVAGPETGMMRGGGVAPAGIAIGNINWSETTVALFDDTRTWHVEYDGTPELAPLAGAPAVRHVN